MRRVEQLIQQVRLQTENQRSGVTDGISDEEFIQFLNDGQENLLGSILQTNARAFSKVAFIDLVRGTSNYTLPQDVFLNSRIVLVEFSSTGHEKDFYPLGKNVTSEIRRYEGYPWNYVIQGSELIISPTPDRSVTGGIRITYDPVLRRIDKRRATVAAVTILSGAVTSLTLSTASPFNASDYALFDYLSFVDAVGSVKASNFRFDAVDSGTGVVTIPGGSHALASGETIAIGDNVVLGEQATTHCQFPNYCEKYLINYCAMRIFARDSSTDMADQKMLLDEIEQIILSNYQESSGDIDEVPVTDFSYYPEGL